MQTEQTEVNLFSDTEIHESVDVQQEIEKRALELIPTGIIKSKSHLMIQMSEFYCSTKTKDIRRLCLNRLNETNRPKEFPHVYEPINQIAAFESMRVPLIFKEDGCFEEIVRNTIMHFFPKCTIKKENSPQGEVFVLILDSVPFRRFRYLERLIDEDTSWVPFLTNNLSQEMRINTEARTFENRIMNNSNREFKAKKVRKNLEEKSLSYDSIEVTLPISSEFYFNTIKSGGLSVPGELIDILNDLIRFSSAFHFLSDSYKEINEMINAEFEKEKITYAEKQQTAYNLFQSEIHSRIIPVEALTHKAARAMADKKNMSEVFVPYSSEEPITLNKDIKLSVYVKNSNTSLQEWYLLPPAKDIIDIPEMDYQGVLDYVKYDNSSYVAKKEKAYHVVGVETLLNTKIDEKMFMQMIIDEYKEHPMYETIVNSLEILNQYPQTFRGISVHNYQASLQELTQPQEEEQLEDDNDDTGWFEDALEDDQYTPESSKPSITNAFSSLKTVIRGTGVPVVIKENSLVTLNPDSEVAFAQAENSLSESYLKDTLFVVQSISLKQQDSQNKLYFKLACLSSLSSDTDFQEADSIEVTISEQELVLPDIEFLMEHYRNENFNTALASDVAIGKELLTDFASREGYIWPSTVDEVSSPNTAPSPVDFNSLPIRNISSLYVYAVDNRTNTFYVFKNKEVIYTSSLENSHEQTISDTVFAYVNGLPPEATGVHRNSGTFILPIYSTNGGVISHSVFN